MQPWGDQVHSDAIQAGLETIKKLLDGRIEPEERDNDDIDIDDEDDDDFFERLRQDASVGEFEHRAIAA